jgi:thiol-disulfide isomerase/thioredoxin
MNHASLLRIALGVALGAAPLLLSAGCDRAARSSAVDVGAAITQVCTNISPECLPKVQYVDTNGTRHAPTDLAGKVVIVNLWATWCGPCKSELPEFSKVAAAYAGKDVVIMGLLTDDPDQQTLLDFMTEHQIGFPVIPKDMSILRQFDYPRAVPGIPTTFAYDKKGNRRRIKVGPMHEKELRGVIDALLAET